MPLLPLHTVRVVSAPVMGQASGVNEHTPKAARKGSESCQRTANTGKQSAQSNVSAPVILPAFLYKS